MNDDWHAGERQEPEEDGGEKGHFRITGVPPVLATRENQALKQDISLIASSTGGTPVLRRRIERDNPPQMLRARLPLAAVQVMAQGVSQVIAGAQEHVIHSAAAAALADLADELFHRRLVGLAKCPRLGE